MAVTFRVDLASQHLNNRIEQSNKNIWNSAFNQQQHSLIGLHQCWSLAHIRHHRYRFSSRSSESQRTIGIRCCSTRWNHSGRWQKTTDGDIQSRSWFRLLLRSRSHYHLGTGLTDIFNELIMSRSVLDDRFPPLSSLARQVRISIAWNWTPEYNVYTTVR